MANINIPLEAHINTADDHIIHEIDSQTKDCMNKKNTLKFKKCLSPLWKKSDEAIYTTAGHIIKKSPTGYYLLDETGKKYSYDPSYVVTNSFDLKNLWTGECTSAWSNGYNIYSTWKTNENAYIIKTDMSLNILKNTEINFSDTVDFNIKIVANNVSYPNFYVVTIDNRSPNNSSIHIYDADTGASIARTSFNHFIGKDLYTYKNGNIIYIGIDDVDVRKRFTYTFTPGATTPIAIFIAGFGCIGSNGLITGEPLPREVDTVTFADISTIEKPTALDSSYIFLENGIGAKDTMNDAESSPEDWMLSNSALEQTTTYSKSTITEQSLLTWGNMTHIRNHRCIWLTGWDLISNKPLVVNPTLNLERFIRPEDTVITEQSISLINKYYSGSETSFLQVDFSDSLGNTSWNSASPATIENGCNAFPYKYYIFNRAESKGVYWDYGPGWCKSYIRQGDFNILFGKMELDQRWPTAIVSYGLSSSTGSNSCRIEYLSPFNFDSTTYSTYEIIPSETSPQAYSRNFIKVNASETTLYSNYWGKTHMFNPDVFKSGMIWTDMIGADNLPNHSVLNVIPFNVDIDSKENIKEQYYQGNYVSTSMQGTLLTSGALKNKGTTIYSNVDNFYSIYSNSQLILVEKNPEISAIKLDKVADYIYKLNTLKGNNLFIDSKESFYGERGFIPFNGEELITLDELKDFSSPSDNTDTDGNSVYYSASGYNINMTEYENRATSYLLPAIEFPITIKSDEVENFTFQLINNKHELTKPLLYNQFTNKDEGVDHFYNHSLNSTSIEYQDTKKIPTSPLNHNEELFGIKTYDIDKANTVWWITSDIQIFPIGIASKISGVNYLTSTLELSDGYTVRLYRNNNTTFLTYNPNTSVYKGSTIFTIYGYNYSFDGQAIYYLGSGDDTSQVSFACYALGMKFLANSGTEAYFYSSFEKRIYLFTGSVTLQAADLLSREGNIVDSLYSSLEQTLYLMTDEGNIIARTQNDMAMITNINPSNFHFESTDTGMILQGNWIFERYRLWKTDEEEFLPLEYETEYLGKNDSLFKVSNIDITLFRNDGEPISGSLIFGMINDKQKTNETIKFNVSKADFANATLVKMRLVPKNNVMKALNLNIRSDDFISIASVCVNIEEVSSNTNAPAKLHK